jgi:UPF0755 protein
MRRAGPLLALVTLGAVAWFLVSLYQPLSDDGSGRVRVTIPSGSTAGSIGDLLEEKGVIDSSFFFGLRARLSGDRERLRSGTFTLREDMPYDAVLTALTTVPPPPKVIKVLVPEGKSRREIVPIVTDSGLRGDYLRVTKRNEELDPRDYGAPKATRSLEGFLFPATYELRPTGTARQLVVQQLEAFKRAFDELDLRRAKRRNLDAYDVLIIASMIEREAGTAKDRRLISAVIHNRLRQHMPLGIDATIRYAENNWERPLRVSELERDGPYNTRKRQGLPPTPIGNPGVEAIKAAARPASVPYLYYVVKPCGNGAHAFSASDAQFQRDVAAYNRKREELGGKDPSRC